MTNPVIPAEAVEARVAIRFVIDTVIKNRMIDKFNSIRLNPARKPLLHKGRKP